MPFLNRIRLRLYVSKPQFPDDRNVFRLADGSKKVQSIVVKKVYSGITDYYPEWIHQRLKIALSHDTVNIEGDKYLGGISVEGDYEIEWQDFKDYPYAQATFKAEVTPFDATNSNCQTCDEATQLNLVDDHFTGELEQSTEYTLDVFANDSINCTPITVSITYINAVFIASADIDETTGILTITTKPLFFQRNTEKILTYRVTCSNGGYDEADVFADLIGDIAACLEPTDVFLTSKSDTSAAFEWTAPGTPPDDGYEWKVVTAASPAVTMDSGTTTGTNITVPVDADVDLDASTGYIFSIRSVCDVDVQSNWVNVSFTTDSIQNACGKFWVEYFDEFTNQDFKDVTYIACNGMIATIRLHSYKRRSICVLINADGSPVSIIGADSITFFRPC